MNFDQELKQRVQEIEGILKKYLPKEEGAQKVIFEAMNYSLMAGGKRLRPLLMAETFHLFGGIRDEIIEPFMTAMEMIHTYSLVHDDLPAMDDDEYRRGRKTTHVVYGEAMGILAGDGLLNYAFETAVKAFACAEASDYPKVAEAFKVLSTKAGVYGMIGGQVIDIGSEDIVIDVDRLNLMYRLKTGALIEASMMIGAILAGANESEIQAVEQVAGAVGLAFQIKDDILDVTSTQEVLGKPIHSDEKNEKTTYVTLLGLAKANDEVVRISNLAIDTYHTLPYKNEFLEALILMLISREK